METARRRRTRSASSSPRCRGRRRGCRPRKEGPSHRGARGLPRKIRGTETERLKVRVHAAVGVMRRPTRLVLEETNRTNAAVRAEIEPVMRPLRHANQVARFDLDREHGAGGWMN